MNFNFGFKRNLIIFDYIQMQGKKPDPDFDLIIDRDLLVNRWPQALEKHQKSSNPQSIMSSIMTRQMFEKYKDHKTAHGWTISRSINTGVINLDSLLGCHVGDLETFHDFKDLFYPVIERWHFGFKMDGSMKHITDLDVNKIQHNLSQSALDKIVSTRTRCARNLSMFPLNTNGTKQSRLQVLELMEKVVQILPEDLRGKMYRHTDMTKEQIQQLIDNHYLFKGGNRMQAASGYHLGWPIGRGIFVSHDKNFLVWINQGDHLRIISMQKEGNIKSVFARFARAVNCIEEGIKKVLGVNEVFLCDPTLGMIACCPSNVGTCMRSSVHIILPKLIKQIGFKEIDNIARTMGCQARGSAGEFSEVVDKIDISNWRRLGQPEYRLIDDMIRCANQFAVMEDKIKN